MKKIKIKSILVASIVLILLTSCYKERQCEYSCEYRQYENGQIVYRSTGYDDEIRTCSETPNSYVSGNENLTTFYNPDGSSNTIRSGVYCSLK